MRFRFLSVFATERAGCETFVEDLLLVDFVADGPFDILAGVAFDDLTAFFADSDESGSDSKGRFLVMILEFEPVLIPSPKKLKGSDDLMVVLDFAVLDVFVADADLTVVLVDFSV